MGDCEHDNIIPEDPPLPGPATRGPVKTKQGDDNSTAQFEAKHGMCYSRSCKIRLDVC